MRIGIDSRWGLLLFFAAATALVLGTTVWAGTNRQAAASIEGTWTYGSGQVLVTPLGGDAYLGTVTKTAIFSAGCPHPVGEQVWRMKGGGQHYDGTHEGYGPGGCTDRRTFPSTWEVSESAGEYTVEECVTVTTDSNRVDCQTFHRAKPPATVAQTRTVVFSRAYSVFPASRYDSKVARSYRRATGSVTISRTAGILPLLVKARGLVPAARYAVYLDTNGLRRGVVTTAGPWRKLGTFRATRGGIGTFRGTLAPVAGSVVAIGVEPSRTLILISATLP